MKKPFLNKDNYANFIIAYITIITSRLEYCDVHVFIHEQLI